MLLFSILHSSTAAIFNYSFSSFCSLTSLWSSIYLPHPSYLIKLQRLQNKAIRIITNSDQMFISPNYFILEILKIPELYRLEIAKLTPQHSKQILPHCISTLFKLLSFAFERITRNKPKIQLSHC